MTEFSYLSTDQIEPSLRNEYWREIARPFFDTTLSGNEGNAILEGSLAPRLIGSLMVGPTSFNRQHNRRDRNIVLRGGLDQYFVQLFVAGALDGECCGQTIAVRPGDICVFDLSRTFTSRIEPGSTLSVILPRAPMDKAADGRSVHGTVLKAGDPVTRLLADFIVSLSGTAAELAPADTSIVEEAAISLLANAIARRSMEAATAEPSLARVLRRRVLEFIDANLVDPELGPDQIMQRFRVSRAHLYRMFAADGGVATIVRERRLDAAYRELARTGSAPRTISEIAHDFGFSGGNQFLRAFRSRFAVTPTEARQEGLALGPPDRRLEGLHAHFARLASGAGPDERIPEAGGKGPISERTAAAAR
jgi:AraC-like DNA-binding protein